MSVYEETPTPSESTAPVVAEITPALVRKRRSQLEQIWYRFTRNKLAVIGAVVLIILTLLAVFAPRVSNADPTAIDLNSLNSGPTLQHLLGTDDLGRDTFTRALYGARVSLLIGIFSMAAAILFGSFVGAVAGYYGGLIDNILMRVTDIILSFPIYLLLFVLAVVLTGGGVERIVLLLAALTWPSAARLVRGEFLTLKEREFVLAARTTGARDPRLIITHILPNALGPVIVNATLLVGNNIITESTISFFGFGVQPPSASWGNMLAGAQDYIQSDPLLVFVPGMLILITVLCFNLIGDGLRDALDPRASM